MIGASFDSTKTPLHDLLARADGGKLQLPDFQRGWVWDDDREDALLSVPEDRQVKAFGGEITLDLTTPGREYDADLFPVNRIFESAEWRQAYSEHWNFDRDKMRLFNELEREVIKRFEQYQVPVIELKKETPKEAVCLVFERVNTGGMALNVFELLTASFAADDFQLRDDWNAREQGLKGQHPVLRNLQSDDFLQAISLLVTQTRRRGALAAGVGTDTAPGISCKRKDILKLEVADWQAWASRTVSCALRASFTGRRPSRRGICPTALSSCRSPRYLWTSAETGRPRAHARRSPAGTGAACWASSTAAPSRTDSRATCRRWWRWYAARRPSRSPIQESSFQANRLLTLRTRNSSAYKGLYALLMRDGGRDFRTGEPIEAQTFFDDKVDIHHIFPEKWCKAAGIEPDTYNSVINKTALAARTNRQIGGKAPSKYLPAIGKAAGGGPGRMGEILASHRIAPEHLRADRFWDFYAARAEALLQRIEVATGKSITREPELFRAGVVAEACDEGPEEWDAEEPLEEAVS